MTSYSGMMYGNLVLDISDKHTMIIRYLVIDLWISLTHQLSVLIEIHLLIRWGAKNLILSRNFVKSILFVFPVPL